MGTWSEIDYPRSDKPKITTPYPWLWGTAEDVETS